MSKMKTTYEVMLGLAAEMAFDEAFRKKRRDEIHDEIDAALEAGNKDAFMKLTEELKALNT